MVARDAAKHPRMHRKAPTAKNYPSAEEKHCQLQPAVNVLKIFGTVFVNK